MAFTGGADHGVGTTDTGKRLDTGYVVEWADTNDRSSLGRATFVSFITNGVRINWATGEAPASAYLINVIFFAGTDVTADVGSIAAPTTVDGTVDITTIGFEPDIVFGVYFIQMTDAGSPNTGTHIRGSFGVAHNGASVVQRSGPSWQWRPGVVTTDDRSALSATYMNRGTKNTGNDWGISLDANTFDSQGFTIQAKDEVRSDTDFFWLALKFNGAININLHTTTTPTTTGEQEDTTPGWTPQALVMGIALGDSMDVVYGGTGGDLDGGAVGLAFADGNDDIYFMGAASETNVETTNTQSLADTKIHALFGDGSAGVVAEKPAGSIMTANGHEFNFSTVDTTAKSWWVLAFEEAVGVTVTPTPASAVAATVDPAVLGPWVEVTPDPAAATAGVKRPAIIEQSTGSQNGRPDGDISAGVWYESAGDTQSNLYTVIDEPSRSDSDYIYTGNGDTGYCEVTLSDVSDPLTSDNHDINYAYRRTNGAKNMTLVVSLRQGSSTEIASWTHVNPSAAFTLAEQTLTSGQANNITNYNDLRLRFDVTVSQNPGACQVSWAEFSVPLANPSVVITPQPAGAAGGTVDPTVVEPPTGVTVTPNPAESVAGVTAPTVVYGSLSITPSPAESVAGKADPTVIKGSTSVTPIPAASVAGVVAPTVIKGSLAITPDPAASVAGKVDPTVLYGSTTATPSAVGAVGATLDPTVVKGSLSLSPSAAESVAATVDPTVVEGGDVLVTPDPAAAVSATVDPTVIYGSLAITPTAAGAISTTVNPTVLYGSAVATPDPAAAIGATVDPTVVKGSLVLTPSEASAVSTTVNPTIILGSTSVTPNPAAAVAEAVIGAVLGGGELVTPTPASAVSSTVNPTVILGSVSVTPTPAAAIGATLAPTVIYGSLAITPAAAESVGTTADPTVVTGGDIIITPDPAESVSSTVNPAVLLGSTTATPTPAEAVSTTTDPTVVLGSQSITPGAAEAVAATVDPAVTLGSITMTPVPAIAVTTTTGPTVELGSITMTPTPADAVAGIADPTVIIVSPVAADVALEVTALNDLAMSSSGRYILALDSSGRYILALDSSGRNTLALSATARNKLAISESTNV
jgi:hypothetical protein